MKYFNPIFIEPVEPISLDRLHTSLATIDKGNKEAINYRNQIREQFAKMDFNEKDLPYLDQKLNELDNAINNFSIGGNAHYAIQKLMDAGGGIAGDKVIWDKYRDNQDYKRFKEGILNDKSLGDIEKQYFITHNQYDPNNIQYDENGKALGTKGWNPTETAVPKVSFDDIIRTGAKYAAEESGKGESYVFLHKNSTVDNPILTTNFSESTGELYMKTSTGYRRMPKEKLMRAYKLGLDNLPNARESLNQQYNIGLWDFERNGGKTAYTDLTNAQGRVLTEDEWIDKHLSTAAGLGAYYINEGKGTDYGNALANLRAGTGGSKINGGNKTSTDIGAYDPYGNNNLQQSITTPTMMFQIDTGDAEQNSINNSAYRLKYFYGNLTGHEFTVPDRVVNANKIKEMASRRLGRALTPTESANIDNLAEDYNLSQKVRDDVFKQAGATNKTESDAYKFQHAINTGAKVNKDNIYQDKIMKKWNNMFQSGKVNNIEITFDNDDTAKKFYKLYFGNSNMQKMLESKGIHYDGNKNVLTINYKADAEAYRLMKAINDAETQHNDNMAHNWFTNSIVGLADMFSLGNIQSQYDVKYYDKNNNEIGSSSYFKGNKGNIKSTIRSISTFENELNKANANINNKVKKNTTKTITGAAAGQQSYTQIYERNLYYHYLNYMKASDAKALTDKNVSDINNQMINVLKNTDFGQLEISGGMLNGDGSTGVGMIVKDANEKRTIGQEVKKAISKGKDNVIVRPFISKEAVDSSGNPMMGYVITYPIYESDNKTIKGYKQYYAPHLYDETAAQMLAANPYIKYTTKLNQIKKLKNGYNLTNNRNAEGNYTLKYNKSTGTYNMNANGINSTIDESKAMNIVTLADYINNTSTLIRSNGDVDVAEFINNIIAFSQLTNADACNLAANLLQYNDPENKFGTPEGKRAIVDQINKIINKE